MHVFLTGEIGIGKTTIIQKTLNALQIPIGGFITYFGEDRYEDNKELYMNGAWLPKEYKKNLSVASFTKGAAPLPSVKAFDSFGVQWIRDSRSFAALLLMDECGRFENQAMNFQNEIFKSLNGEIPILGVLKKIIEPSWLDRIKNHPKVNVITVTKENRNDLADILVEYYKSLL